MQTKKRPLLNIDGNPKTVKGQKEGYMTAILYLAPWKAAGVNLCPMAELAGCFAGCLNQAGHGGMAKANATIAPYGVEVADNNVQRARIARSRRFIDNQTLFMADLHREIVKFIARAGRKGLTPVVRLNGTSDIQWEKIQYRAPTARGDYRTQTVFDHFADIQFYDYTKIAKRFERPLPANYHLSLSYSEASPVYALRCLRAADEFQAPLVIVVRDDRAKEIAQGLAGDHYVNGDDNDLRFTDPVGARVYLKAKGPARKDTSGFVIDLS